MKLFAIETDITVTMSNDRNEPLLSHVPLENIKKLETCDNSSNHSNNNSNDFNDKQITHNTSHINKTDLLEATFTDNNNTHTNENNELQKYFEMTENDTHIKQTQQQNPVLKHNLKKKMSKIGSFEIDELLFVKQSKYNNPSLWKWKLTVTIALSIFFACFVISKNISNTFCFFFMSFKFTIFKNTSARFFCLSFFLFDFAQSTQVPSNAFYFSVCLVCKSDFCDLQFITQNN